MAAPPKWGFDPADIHSTTRSDLLRNRYSRRIVERRAAV
jgi:hypothetical protein